jgi:hypothetical protein
MATNLLDRVPSDRIQAEARQVHLGRALLTALVGVFWLLGWLAGKVTVAVGFAWAAAKVGWQDARQLERAEVSSGRRAA